MQFLHTCVQVHVCTNTTPLIATTCACECTWVFGTTGKVLCIHFTSLSGALKVELLYYLQYEHSLSESNKRLPWVF